MSLKYLIDENVDPAYSKQLRRNQPTLIVRLIGEPDTPSKGTKDTEILLWCEEYGFVLVTNNRKSMPVHLLYHIEQGNHILGIFILNSNLSIGQNLEELILIAESYFNNEYQDQIIHLPLTTIVS